MEGHVEEDAQSVDSSNDIDDNEIIPATSNVNTAGSDILLSKSKNPQFLPSIWMISVRNRMNDFNQRILMFRPDCRLFCSHGSKCKVRNEDHHERYNHVLPEVVATVKPTETNPYGIPNVERTWSLDSGDINDFEGLPRNSSVVIYVHGHRTRFYRCIAATCHIHSICNAKTNYTAATNRKPVHTVAFLWPCHKKIATYGMARDKARNGAAMRLRFSIQVLQLLGNVVHVIGHSLGSLVSLEALNHSFTLPNDKGFLHNILGTPTLKEATREENKRTGGEKCAASSSEEMTTNETDVSLQSVASLMLVGAAVPSDSVNKDELPNCIASERTINFFTNNDPVLAESFDFAESVAGGLSSVFNFFRKRTKALGSVGSTATSDKLASVTPSSSGMVTSAAAIESIIYDQQAFVDKATAANDGAGEVRRESSIPLYSKSANPYDGEKLQLETIVAYEDVDLSASVHTHSVHAYIITNEFQNALLQEIQRGEAAQKC